MRSLRHIIFLLLFGILVSCQSHRQSVHSLQRMVQQRIADAEVVLTDVTQALDAAQYDRIRALATGSDGILFQIYDGPRLLFWSGSWLSFDPLRFRTFDHWSFQQWNNAQGLFYCTRHGRYIIELRLPVKYHYKVGNIQLHNDFIPPFNGQESWSLNRLHAPDDFAVTTTDGQYLFSVCMHESGANTQSDDASLAESFSFQCVTQEAKQVNQDSVFWTIRQSTILMIIIALLVFANVLASLYRHKGWSSVPLSRKLQMVISLLIIICCIGNYALSVTFSRKHFRSNQRLLIAQRAEYVQSALRSAYFWDYSLRRVNADYVNAELRDMSFAYGSDIMVFDNDGQLVGSSTPRLFESGILSTRINPLAFFSDDHTMVLDESIGDLKYITAYTELLNGNFTRIGFIAMPFYTSRTQEDIEINRFVSNLMPIFLLIIVITLLLAWLFARRITLSINAISNQVEANRLSGNPHPVTYPFEDEIGTLVHRYNLMLKTMEESARKLAAAERESAWRTMARQVAHEINNTLTPMKLTLQQMQRLLGTERFDGYFRQSSALLVTEIDNLSHIATSFSSFAKMPEVQPTLVDIAHITSDTINLCRANASGIPIRYIGPDSGVSALTDGNQIGQVFINIIKNALQVLETKSDGNIIVQLTDWRQLMHASAPEQGDWVQISISDNGPGIDSTIRDRIFTPNFTTKSTGAGLGLAYAKNVVEGSDGKICFDTGTKGTTFYVFLKKE